MHKQTNQLSWDVLKGSTYGELDVGGPTIKIDSADFSQINVGDLAVQIHSLMSKGGTD